MGQYDMRFYDETNGVSFTMHWQDQREFEEAIEFLTQLRPDGFAGNTLGPGQTPSFYLAPGQLDVLYEYRRRLREARSR